MIGNNLLDYNEQISKGLSLPTPLEENYQAKILELFCDGQLVFQLNRGRITYTCKVDKSYRPATLVVALDGDPVFCLNKDCIDLDRLDQSLMKYLGGDS